MKLAVNGTERDVDAPEDMPLLWVLRDLLGLTGVLVESGVACTQMLIRDAAEEDLPGILAIYNEVMATSTAIFSDQPSTLAWSPVVPALTSSSSRPTRWRTSGISRGSQG